MNYGEVRTWRHALRVESVTNWWQQYFPNKKYWVQKTLTNWFFVIVVELDIATDILSLIHFDVFPKKMFILKTFIWWCDTDTRLSNSSSRCDNCSPSSKESLTSSLETFSHDSIVLWLGQSWSKWGNFYKKVVHKWRHTYFGISAPFLTYVTFISINDIALLGGWD